MSKRVYITRQLQALQPEYPSDWQVRSWHSEEEPVDHDELELRLLDAEGLLCMLTDKIGRRLLDKAPKLRVIATMSVGYDHIDVEECTRRGILVCNTPDVLTETTADLVFALLLATARRLPEAEQFVRNNEWQGWSPRLLAGRDVYGKTLGIIGLGRIGQAVARRAAGFHMRILYHNRKPNPDREQVGFGRAEYRTKEELLKESDFVCLLAPYNEDSRDMIGVDELRLMQPTAYLINAARGELVDEYAVVQAVREGWIAGAGFDVYREEPLPVDHPLRTCENVVLLPHIGSSSIETRREMARMCVRNIAAALDGRRPVQLVNPEALGERGSTIKP